MGEGKVVHPWLWPCTEQPRPIGAASKCFITIFSMYGLVRIYNLDSECLSNFGVNRWDSAGRTDTDVVCLLSSRGNNSEKVGWKLSNWLLFFCFCVCRKALRRNPLGRRTFLLPHPLTEESQRQSTSDVEAEAEAGSGSAGSGYFLWKRKRKQ